MKKLRAVIVSPQVAGWADQLVVSGANLLLLLAVARWASVADVGYYAIGFSLLVMAVTVQDSLVTRPFTVQMFKLPTPAQHQAAGSLAFALLLGLGLAAAAAIFAAVFAATGAAETGMWLALVLAIAIPPVLLREFARRIAFAHLAPVQALAVDGAATLVSVIAIGGLGLAGQLNALGALLALAAGSGVAVAGWLIHRRRDFAFERAAAMATIRQSFGLGKWLLSDQLALKAQGYAAHWITLAIGGAAVTGLYSACLSIVALTNPFLFGYFNILTPRYVRILKNDGAEGLRRHALRGAMFLGAVTGVFALAVALFGSDILGLMFPGESYQAGAGVLTLLAVAAVAGSMGGTAGVALMAAERGKPLAALSTVICIGGSVLVMVLMWQGGLAAAAAGILMTEVAGALARWAMLLRLPSHRHAQEQKDAASPVAAPAMS